MSKTGPFPRAKPVVQFECGVLEQSTSLPSFRTRTMSQLDPAAAPHILSVGQCGFDHRSISSYLADQFAAEVERVDSMEDTRDAMKSVRYDLVLVNRILDENGSSGLELIRALKHVPALADVPVMLVSDHADAQKAALNLGASPGFGKASLHSDLTLARIRALLGGRSRPGLDV